MHKKQSGSDNGRQMVNLIRRSQSLLICHLHFSKASNTFTTTTPGGAKKLCMILTKNTKHMLLFFPSVFSSTWSSGFPYCITDILPPLFALVSYVFLCRSRLYIMVGSLCWVYFYVCPDAGHTKRPSRGFSSLLFFHVSLVC